VADAEEDSADDELLELSAAGVITTGADLSRRYKGPFKPQPVTSTASVTIKTKRNILAPA
jgi:hypothetical protein